MSTVAAAPDVAAGPRRAHAGRRIVLVAVVLGVAAAVLRLVLVLQGGGIAGTGNYDDGVYFGAAEALVHGRAPYLAYLFLQPPGVLLALAPFAALTGLVGGDAHAFEIARLAGYVFAGVTTAFVVLAMRRVGLTAAVVAGVVFALIEPSVFTSRSTLLEPIGAFVSAAVLALLAGAPPERGRGRVRAVLCGLLLAFSVSVKIWALVQAVVFLVAARRRHPLLLAAGLGAGIVVLFAPFFVQDPGAMWRQVVSDQIGRPRIDPVLLERLGDVVGTPPVLATVAGQYRPVTPPVQLGLDPHAVTAVLLVVVLLAAVAGWRYPVARLATVQLVGAVVVLLASPSFYDHYAMLATPFLAVVVGGGAGGILRRTRRRRRRRVVAAALVAAVTGYCVLTLVGSDAEFMLSPKIGSALDARISRMRGCVTSDDPTLLVLSDRLTPELEAGCPFWPDLTGWSLDEDRPPADVDPATYRLEDDGPYQSRMRAYLARGDAIVLGRWQGRLSDATLVALGPFTSVEKGRYLVSTR